MKSIEFDSLDTLEAYSQRHATKSITIFVGLCQQRPQYLSIILGTSSNEPL